MSKPRKVVLCGSTRFKEAFEKASRDFTLKGHIVLSVGLFGYLEELDMSSDTKKMLDELHLRKIDDADEVFIVNAKLLQCKECLVRLDVDWHGILQFIRPCPKCNKPMYEHTTAYLPYISESTRNEITYARSHNKRITYLNEFN